MKRKRLKILSIIPIVAIGIGLILGMSTSTKNIELNKKQPLAQEASDLGGPGMPYAGGSHTVGDADSANDMTEMYKYWKGAYCAGFNWQLIGKESNSVLSLDMVDGGLEGGKQETEYVPARDTTMAQSIAYGRFYYPNDDETIQELVWSSWQWRQYTNNKTCLMVYSTNKKYNSMSGGPIGRSYQFANFVYIGLDENESIGLSGGTYTGNGVTTEDNNTSLRTIVDQTNDTYTAGPYMIHIAHGDDNLLNENTIIKDLVWNEIAGINPGQETDNTFCKGKVTAQVSFQNNSSYEADVDVLDESGNKIDVNFPKFDEIFYIRYHTSKDAEIVEKIKPIIKIDYTRKFGGDGSSSSSSSSGGDASSSLLAHTYKSNSVTYSFDQSSGGYKLFWRTFNFFSEGSVDSTLNGWTPKITNTPFSDFDWLYDSINEKNYKAWIDYFDNSWEGAWEEETEDWFLNTDSYETFKDKYEEFVNIYGDPGYVGAHNNKMGKWYVLLRGTGSDYPGTTFEGFDLGSISGDINGATIDEKRSDEFLEQYQEDYEKSLKDYYKNVLGWSAKKVDSMRFSDFNFQTGFYLRYKNSPDGTKHQDYIGNDVGWFEGLNVTLKFTVVDEGQPEVWEDKYYNVDTSGDVVNGPWNSDGEAHANGSSAYHVETRSTKTQDEISPTIRVELQDANTGAKITGIPLDEKGNDYIELEPGWSEFHDEPLAWWTRLAELVNNKLIDTNENIIYYGLTWDKAKVTVDTNEIQPAVLLDIPGLRTSIDGVGGTPNTPPEIITLPSQDINMYYSGNVWQDMPTTTIGEATGHRDGRSLSMAGIQVELWDDTKNYLVARTTTNSEGRYAFQKLNPLHKYRAMFTYDGMRFQSTIYNNNLSGGYSTAREDAYNVSISRGDFNDRFDRIESSPQNYWNESNWWENSRKAYGLYTKLEKSDGTYIRYDGNSGINAGAFRYYDALQIFKDLATNKDNFNNGNASTMDGSYYKIGTGIGGHCNYYSQINFGYSDIEGSFKDRLREIGVDETEINRVWTFIMDTLIQSSTNPYPEQPVFVLEDVDNPSYGHELGIEFLYRPDRDQSRNVDFGIMLRYNLDLWLAKDVYKATVLVNGKQQEYYYNTKDVEGDSSGNWYTNDAGTYDFTGGSDAQNRAGNPQYNGGETYKRTIRKSEYLYDGTDAGTTDDKNLQVFVTYRIAVKNQSQAIWASVDEIVDYYDEAQYYTPVDMPNSTIIKNNTYVGDAAGNVVYTLNAQDKPLTVSDKSIYRNKYAGNNDEEKDRSYNQNTYNINGVYGYKAIYLTGIRSVSGDNKGNSILAPGETTYVYLTFKVKNDDSGKVLLDQNVDDLLEDREEIRLSVGKRNIAEVNGYSTYYDGRGTKAGVLDVDSNPGSFKGYVTVDENGNETSHSPDLDENGNIKSSPNAWENRLEDDGDKSKNLQLVIDVERDDPGDPDNPDDPDGPKDPNDPDNPNDPNNPENPDNDITRSVAGYVYEDARTEVSDGAVIGNGVYNENDKDFEENADKKVNGVTVQLVELVSVVDSEGFPTGVYEKEKIWGTLEYVKDGNNWTMTEDGSRYYSGTAWSRVILSGKGAFKVNPSKIPEGKGIYKYESLPPGDFFIRFIYGDTTQTVLTNVTDGTDSVQVALSKLTDEEEQNFVEGSGNSGILGTSGLNSKTYTGQDYKSTIYQRNVNQNPEVNNYNGIIGYVNTNVQNYNREDVNDKNAMYNYSITYSDRNATAVDRNWNVLRDAEGQEIKVGAGISDAKDVFAYREDERSYSLGSTSPLSEDLQTLKNHRAEVLTSGTQLVTRAEALTSEDRYEEAAYYQREALKELVNNTKMVAQTGIINTEVEYNRKTTPYNENLSYKLTDVDLGLTERPRAQLMLSKELTNIQVRLANGQILFDTNQSVNNLYYGKHKVFSLDEYYNTQYDEEGNPGYRLRKLLAQAEKDRQEELIQISMDEELMVGATVRMSYRITVDNIGEVDYLDKDFYYLGKTSSTNWDNVSKTNPRTIIDYVTNEANYEVNYQDDVSNWQIITKNILLQKEADKEYENSGTYDKENLYRVTEDNDYINSYYEGNLDTYNVLVTTKKLSADLLPRALETDIEGLSNSRREINLILSTLLNNATKDENLIYTNLVEVIETSNSWGRRMELSRAGDQGMPYQSNDKSEDDSRKWVKPKGPASDSAQRVVITVPTGENRDYTRGIIIALGSIALIVGAIVIIKKKILKK